MKIRNTKTNIEISSPHIDLWSYKGEEVFFDEESEKIFFLRDGWEEVEDETDFVDKWHDLRKNANDLPELSKYDFAFDYKYCYLVDGGYSMLRYSKDGKWYFGLANDRPYNGVIAWMDLPKFNED